MDMLFFVVFFAGAIYYRKRPAQHKTLMLMTAINFSPAAIARLPLLPPELFIIQALVFPAMLGIVCFAWHTWKTRKFNWVFAIALIAFIASGPFRVWFSGTKVWLGFMAWLTS
jgi:multisubunit Na+/H+ antiporter MnhF subunit